MVVVAKIEFAPQLNREESGAVGTALNGEARGRPQTEKSRGLECRRSVSLNLSGDAPDAGHHNRHTELAAFCASRHR
jgi:hypothetical protein